MSEEWTPNRVIEFIDLYEAEPVIWNPNQEHYKNRPLNNMAWKRIEERSSWNVTVAELKKKKESIMPTFRQIMKKSIQNPSFISTWYPFEHMKRFLGPLYEKTYAALEFNNDAEGKLDGTTDASYLTIKNDDSDEETIGNETSDPLVNEFDNEIEIDTDVEDSKPYIILHKGPDRAVQVKKAKIIEHNDQKTYQISTPRTSTPAKKPKLSTSWTERSDRTDRPDRTDRADRSKRTDRTDGTDSDDIDECDLFGKMLATKIRKITNEGDREVLMYDINLLVHKATMKTLKSREK